MAVRVDAALPVHPLTVTDLYAMLEAGILEEDDHVELLDGVLVEMSPQSPQHAYALRTLTMLAGPVAAAAGLVLSIQGPLDVSSPITLPEPDFAIVPVTPIDRHPSGALLVAEMGSTSLRIDLGPKARIYAEAGVPDYWVLDVKRREIVVHREPSGSRFEHVQRFGAGESVTALAVALAVPVASLV
jgi:Uma2 family endonuclease